MNEIHAMLLCIKVNVMNGAYQKNREYIKVDFDALEEKINEMKKMIKEHKHGL